MEERKRALRCTHIKRGQIVFRVTSSLEKKTYKVEGKQFIIAKTNYKILIVLFFNF